ncbi:hypothetical protein IW140_005998 [Coemansia sp. RSA 1813]|nr:hypothetical protein EV178_005992 [Coemansia sp. RSA 1646]KAJ1767255.1 hypothetical protein LPJ74_005464 [Coemansia sp. RSA 1843]KAJ2210813.1 hypothetical protein EV179_005966 [Coemansia sp. RSA 487]KAJ2563759.1 hypothetical protein IW140_005998 [Coemansia sp. RSA 1813]
MNSPDTSSSRNNNRVPTPSRCDSSVSSTPTLHLDNLRTHHTQALVNVVSSTLYSTPIDVPALELALKALRRHLESPQNYTNAHPAAKTNAIEVLEHIVVCWVCAQASQADAQNYSLASVVETDDGQFDKYAEIPEKTAMEAVQCVSYLVTMSVGTAAVARTSIPTSLVLSICFIHNPTMLTAVFRTLTKLCTKHSVRRAKADGRWESETGIYAVMDAFSRAMDALTLRNRFDTLGNSAFAFASDFACLEFPQHQQQAPLRENSHKEGDPRVETVSIQNRAKNHSNDQAALSDRTVACALALANAIVEAHGAADERLRVRKELLDTPLYRCLKLLEEPELAGSKAHHEAKRFRHTYGEDIRLHNPAMPSDE